MSVLFCSTQLDHILVQQEYKSILFILFSVSLHLALDDGSSLHTHVVEVEVKNKLFGTTPSSRVNACICKFIMWLIFNVQGKNKRLEIGRVGNIENTYVLVQ
jgi:hypothetical protein